MARIATDKPVSKARVSPYDLIYLKSYKIPSYNPDVLTTQRGYDVMDDMLNMAAVRAPTNVKRYAVIHKPWSVVPRVLDPHDSRSEQSGEIAKFCQYALENIEDEDGNVQDMRAVMFEILSACHFGFSATEKVWKSFDKGDYKGKWGFSRFSAKRQAQIGFSLSEETLAVSSFTNLTPGKGFQDGIPRDAMVLYTYNPDKGLPHGRGDSRAAYKHWHMYNTALKQFAIALERFGSPFPTAQGPTAATDVMDSVLEAMARIRSGGDAIFPEGINFEIHELQGQALMGFIQAFQHHSEMITFNILLQQLTTHQGAGQGSYALGEIHEHTQGYALSHVRRDLEKLIELEIMRFLVRYNFGEDAVGLTPRFSLGDWDAKDNALLAEIIDSFLTNGVLFKTEKFIRDKMNFPPIDAESERLRKEEEARGQELEQMQARSKLGGGKSNGG
jgi:phage gp29-like protein